MKALISIGALLASMLVASAQDATNVTAATPPAVAPAAVPAPDFPALPEPHSPVPYVNFYIVHLEGSGPGRPMQLDIYLPVGRHDAKSLPCVFIAPAGNGNHGGKVADGDRPEHLPYVQAGFAVVAYELSGSPDDPNKKSYTYGEMKRPVSEFVHADGGVVNGQNAIDYVLKMVPEVDPAQLFACGHSSAASVALNFARAEKRIRACCAYAPQPDYEKWLGDPKWDTFVPGYTAFLAKESPLAHVADFDCPVYLFHADDDSMVPLAAEQNFADAMKAAGKQITFERVPTGDHYQSMIVQGIPGGIQFMESVGAKPMAPVVQDQK
jgi:dienelactone hydrolase